jgi:hypothetical protein
MVFRLEIDGLEMLSFHGILLVLPNALASIQCIFLDIVRIAPMLLLTTKIFVIYIIFFPFKIKIILPHGFSLQLCLLSLHLQR